MGSGSAEKFLYEEHKGVLVAEVDCNTYIQKTKATTNQNPPYPLPTENCYK